MSADPSELEHLQGRIAQLEQSLEAYQRLFEICPVGIAINDAERRFIDVNQRALQLFGMRREEVIGHTSLELGLIAPDDTEEHKALGVRVQESASVQKAARRMRSKTGEIHHLVILVDMMEVRGERRFVSTFLDVTEAERIHQLLVASEGRYRQIVETTPAGVCITDSHGIVNFVNSRWDSMLGRASGEMLGHPVFDVMDAAARDTARLHLTQHRQSAAVEGGEIRVTRSDGSPLWVRFDSSRIVDNKNAYVGVLMLLLDISEQKRVQEALDTNLRKQAENLVASERDARELARIKSDFLASMSHEIRTPMNGVLGMADLLLETELDDEQRRYAQTIQTCGQGLLSIINEILDLSRIEAGKVVLERITFDLRRVVETQAQVFSAIAQRKGIALTTVVDASLPTTLRGDASRIGQVLLNLIGNALKFTTAGTIQITATRAEGSLVLFKIQDSGIGIAPDVLQRLFQPFSQADDETARTYGGTGLGLSISRQLVTLMGGDIGVTSTPGAGSMFWFKVDLPEAAPSAATEAAVPAAPEDSDGLQRKRILVAEDNAVNQALITAVLKKLGVVPQVVTNGQEALDALTGAAFDMVLMDCQMPVLDGIETTRRWRAIEQRQQGHVPIIALTASVMEDEQQRCKQAGMDGFLAKPLDREALRSTLLHWLLPTTAP